MTYKKLIWWIQRDFRLLDNPALEAALATEAEILPVYVFDTDWLQAEDTSALHVQAVIQALTGLRAQLARRGASLAVFRGRTVEVFEFLLGRLGLDAVFTNHHVGTDRETVLNRAVEIWCRQRGLAWLSTPQTGVFPEAGRAGRERHWQDWINQPLPPAPERLPGLETELGRQLPTLADFGLGLPVGSALQQVDERMGRRSLQTFLSERGQHYLTQLDSPLLAAESGSRLSVHLAWGTLSPRVVWQQTRRRLRGFDAADDAEAVAWRNSLEAFRLRLQWRDHLIQRLASEPEMEFRALHPAFRYLSHEQRHAHRYLQAWCSGQTGYPLVDAAMRCLNVTGFVPFQLRAMLVSFACHVLQLDWRSLHPHLARRFTDYEPGIHFSQLQIQAGVTGINGLKVYSPLRQLMLHDPQLIFVQRWVPELQGATLAELTLGQPERFDYPGPIVPFGPRARETLERIYAIKAQQQHSPATLEVVQRHADRPRRRRLPEAS